MVATRGADGGQTKRVWRRDSFAILRPPRSHPPGDRRGLCDGHLLPSLFVPGFPKSATTWLFSCMSDAFHPTRVCGGTAEHWNASCAPRRFLLFPLQTGWRGGVPTFSQRKETFFYGGSRAGRSALPLAPLHGPDTRHGALSARPSLWPWEQQSTRRGRVTPPQVLADLCAANSSRTAAPDAG